MDSIHQLAAASIENFRLPKYSEIPDVGLFLEQTTKYISQCLAPLGCVSLTSSMISNYVKMHLIESPVKRQYSREQIAYLIVIAIAKTCCLWSISRPFSLSSAGSIPCSGPMSTSAGSLKTFFSSFSERRKR